jgi:hypothetical protein
MQELWDKFKDTNSALPNAIQLRLEIGSHFPDAGENAVFVEWLRAPNGSALGFTGDAVRYIWHVRGQHRSNNFWIRWDLLKQGYVLNQRTSTSIPPLVAEYRFDQGRTAYMTKCLVLGKRISARSVRKKRLWFA